MDRSWGALLLVLFVTLAAGACLGATYRSYDDLNAAAIIVSDHTSATFERARAIAEGAGARGLQMYPPDAIFGYFPARPEQSLFAGLAAQLAFSRDDLAGKGLDGVVEKVLGDLFNQKNILMSAPPVNAEPFNDPVLRVPGEIIRATSPSGPRTGSPRELTDRGIQQNSEFMIGSIAVNVIFPESTGHDEDWTDQEIADAMSAISLGVSQYMEQALWVDMSFTYNFKNFKRVPVTMEPIESNMNTDPIWMGQALADLGYDEGAYVGAYELNQHVRDSLQTDWVFTVFVANMANHYNANAPSPDPGCWGGAGYVAYSYLGGPYLLVPYPACRYGYGLGFGRVFIHEMSHIFWALDEYASAGVLCTEKTGYLAVADRNTLYKSCQATVPCIMQSGALSGDPLPICEYTMGQVGLQDLNENSIPDIYEVAPIVKFNSFGVQMDTLLPGDDYILSATVTNAAVPNNNPQEDTTYMTRISYAPYIKNGEMSLNGQPFVALTPIGGKWNSANEDIGMTMTSTDFLPGSNAIAVRVKNRVEMSAVATKNVYVIGLKYYHVSTAVRDTSIKIEWTTAADVFGAVFDVVRTDLTVKGGAETIGSVSVPDESGDRKAYSFIDAGVKAGHEYQYRIVGRFSVTFHGDHHSYEFPSQDVDETALVPIKAGFISNLLPNPTPDHTTFTVNVPRSWRDMSGSRVPAGGAVRLAPSDIEVRTWVDINVYNVLGQRIKNIYANNRFGGTMTLTWDGTDSRGRTVPTGVYFIRVDAGGKTDVKKVVILH
ncbi:MAG: T9SS type A sorting domain-containing protein [Candidatus Krumholzibacteriaceae bacterium]|jgi:hypothetical protein